MDEISLNPTVLLVDADEVSAEVFLRNFSSAALHWRQLRFKDGREAVHHMIHNGFPNLLATREVNGHLNGLDIVEWMRSLKCPHRISVIIWEKSPSRTLQSALRAFTPIEYLNPEIPGSQLKKALMQIVARTEVAMLSKAQSLA